MCVHRGIMRRMSAPVCMHAHLLYTTVEMRLYADEQNGKYECNRNIYIKFFCVFYFFCALALSKLSHPIHEPQYPLPPLFLILILFLRFLFCYFFVFFSLGKI